MSKSYSKKSNKVTEEDFELIRGLGALGATAKLIALSTGWSRPTVSRVLASATYAEFKTKVRSYKTKPSQPQTPKPASGSGTYEHMELLTVLSGIESILAEQTKALGVLLKRTQKRRLFK